jgi:ribosome-associated protein
MITVTDTISIREDELQVDFVQSSGPGGQNVNKVASKVQLRFDTSSPSLPDEVRQRLRVIARNRIIDNNILLIEAKRYRTQEQNREDAINRLVELIRQATERPKARHRTRPTKASIEKRLESKRRHSETKQMRRRIDES